MRSRNFSRRVLRFYPSYSRSANVFWRMRGALGRLHDEYRRSGGVFQRFLSENPWRFAENGVSVASVNASVGFPWVRVQRPARDPSAIQCRIEAARRASRSSRSAPSMCYARTLVRSPNELSRSPVDLISPLFSSSSTTALSSALRTFRCSLAEP